jgi:outer membrane protein assembly factor BamB
MEDSYMKALLIISTILGLGFTAHAAIKVPGKYTWSGCDTCAEPESAYYDEATDTIFISNVGGVPNEKDGKGWIQKVDSGGKMKGAQWLTGLNAPKGMRSYKGTLWVTDIDEVISIDIASGKITKKIPITGAQFLNDLTVTADGTIYVSDTVGNKIYAIKDGKPEVFVEGEQTDWPNGLLVDGKELVVASWGIGATDWSTKVPGKLFSFNLETKKKTIITKKPLGNLDGLEKFGNDYLVSDWKAGKVYRVSAKGKATELYYGMKGAADIGFITSTKTLIIPRMGENQITAYKLD